MRLGEDVIDYFKAMAEESGVPYQSLIYIFVTVLRSIAKLISRGIKSHDKRLNLRVGPAQIVVLYCVTTL